MSNSRPWPYRNPTPGATPPPQPGRATAVPSPKRGQRPRPDAGRTRPPQDRRQPAKTTVNQPSAVRQSEVASLRSQLQTSPAAPLQPVLWQRIMGNWTLWGFIVLALFGGVATASAVSLFRIPNLPNCRAIFWPTASASTRLQCADAYADQGNVESLLAAIALVEQLPEDHALRAEINERVERWSEQILDIAERTFHEGELEQAIAIASRIPAHTAAAAVVSERVANWETVWSDATEIFATAEDFLRDSQFRQAFSEAIKLRSVGNDYWETTKYEELVNLISTARRDVNVLGQARRLADRGSVSAILEALELVQSISEESHLYGEAQALMKEISREMLDLAENALAREDGTGALNILTKIPPEAGLAAEVADFRTLAQAYELTWDNSVVGYETAIVRLQSISRDRPLYGRAQSLIREWRQEIQGLAQLDWAKQVANPGTVADLQAAIALAQEIDRSSPSWSAAQAQIDRWRGEISRIQDGPYLSQAKALAAAGDRASLLAAIDTARQIGRGSALYGEAQDLIADWRWDVQRFDNAPILAQARQAADQGNIPGAIAIAQQIPQGQALYSDAQNLVERWQGESLGGDTLQTAYQAAQSGTVSNLVQAISLAQQVPQTSGRWNEAQGAINQWSWDILRTAEIEAGRDVARAIDVAQQVPSGTEAYAAAQGKIAEWSALLNP
jgi:hypothetical protein